MEIERYSLKVDPEKILNELIKKRIHEAYSCLSLAERIIREKFGDKTKELNLPLLIGNSVKSVEEEIEFLKILKEKGIEDEDLKIVKMLVEEAKSLLT